jgi:STE24 endopeptidase
MNTILSIFVSLVALKLFAELWLDFLNKHNVTRFSGKVPKVFDGFINQETYDKSVAYTLAKNKFSSLGSVYDGLILLFIILSGILPMFWDQLESLFGARADLVPIQALVLVFIYMGISVFSLPLDWWQQFRLEERFGFNRSTFKLWVSDKIKASLIGLIIGFVLVCCLLWAVSLAHWWIWAFILFMGFQLLMMLLYPMYIMPLFNKFEPLKDDQLRDRLISLAQRVGFKAKAILVMDGSKRSSHSNAFFTGFGKSRRIVLFDTLIEQLTEEEIEAVLAHEIGHYKKKHIFKHLIIAGLGSLFGFWVLSKLLGSSWFLQAFGFEPNSGLAPTLLLFSMLIGLLTFWISPGLNRLSRKYEFEADIFSSEALNTAEPLIKALRKLNEKNLSNLVPHPIYSGFYYSHPTLLEREIALKRA